MLRAVLPAAPLSGGDLPAPTLGLNDAAGETVGSKSSCSDPGAVFVQFGRRT